MFLVVVAVDLYAEAVRWIPAADAARWVMMPLLALHLLLAAPRRGRLLTWTVAALLLSGLGDVVLALLVKIGFFLAAHLCYAVAFWPYRRGSLVARPAGLIGYLLVLGGLIGWIAGWAGDYRWPVVAYGISLAGTGVLAFGLNRTAAVGAALFILSDLVLAVRNFVDADLIPASGLVNMALYLPAQLLLVLGVLQRLRAPEVTSAR